MKILLNCGSASGANYGLFAVSSKQEFKWEEGKQFADTHLDDEIYRHNLKTKARAKKVNKQLNQLYQWSRNGPIVKCLRGPCMNPKLFDDGWFCAYRYKAKTGTAEQYLKSMWWNKPISEEDRQKYLKNGKLNIDMGDKDEPLY